MIHVSKQDLLKSAFYGIILPVRRKRFRKITRYIGVLKIKNYMNLQKENYLISQRRISHLIFLC